MWNIEDIHQLQIEITSVCNAKCPGCARLNLKKFSHMSLEIWNKVIQSLINSNIKTIKFNGNFGDFICHPTSLDFLKLLPKNLNIEISTNGSIRTNEYWKELAKILLDFKNHIVIFGIDGIDQTSHSRHRINTEYNRIINNAQVFIQSGGIAAWKMITFKENKDQILEARRLAIQYKFKRFLLLNSYTQKLNNNLTALDQKEYFNLLKFNYDFSPLEKIAGKNGQENCFWNNMRMLQIMSDGSVWPCCYMALDDLEALPFIKNKNN
jgi:MoaA/NifB/PqqE/SkfB family radical SAM enzyme